MPNLKLGSFDVIPLDENKCIEKKAITHKSRSECNWDNAYSGISTRNVILEERNVFCGSYNVLLLKEKRDPHRVAHLNGSNMVALTSIDKKIRFIDLKSATEKPMRIQGHAGSIRCMFISELDNFVLTGSYDTTIRFQSNLVKLSISS